MENDEIEPIKKKEFIEDLNSPDLDCEDNKSKRSTHIQASATDDEIKKNEKLLTKNREFKEDNIVENIKNSEITSAKILKKKKADYIYDFVKIRVTLDNHFYVLSRFFISRILTLCKVFFFFY